MSEIFSAQAVALCGGGVAVRAKEKTMRTFLFQALVSLVFGFVFGIIGLFVGAWFGGNFATEVVFNGVRGYEATSQIGLILFALVGLVVGWKFMEKRKKKTH